ncbi:uncharacterized protein LOC107304615 [Oryza brachyantha]|uniref:Uncharacterized protein n=1 Tax=Oryza brachyantha TaxID=4533 RepID=J3MIR0_ORYBR|nr:uncharacterized protein LOC107304615 [Oryza brachyantha]
MAAPVPSSPAERALRVLSNRKEVSSLEEIVASGRSGFIFFVASRIKRRTGPPGNGGVTIGNPELLERKKDAEIGVKYGLNLMREWGKEIRGQMKEVEVLIDSIQEKLDAGDDAVPRLGPPHRKRNRVKDRCFYPRESPIPTPMEPSFKRIKLETIDLTASRAADVVAQKAYWRFNLSLLQEKRELLKNLSESIQDSLSHLRADALNNMGTLGAGYADYNPKF